MRSNVKIVLVIISTLILIFCLLFAAGVLSTPRDLSSPQTIIRLFDENGTPLAGIEVGRNWYDSDIGKNGSDRVMTDPSGIARFSKVPAKVGLFTGAWRKASLSLGMCNAGSGTFTTIYVRYHGLCTVASRDKPLQKNQDADGIWLHSSIDSQSNTLASLWFSGRTKDIDYALSSSVHRK